MLKITLKDNPEVKAVILAADPSYRKREAYLDTSETVALRGTYWSGGTCYSYTAVDLAGKRAQGAPQYAPPQFGGPQQTPIVALPIGAAIVRTGHFCGKVSTAIVSVHPQSMAQLLP